jgi:hypothetical protein
VIDESDSGVVMPRVGRRNRGIGTLGDDAPAFEDQVFGGSGSGTLMPPGSQPQAWGLTQTSNTGVVLSNNTSQAVYASASSLLAK